MFVDNYRLPYQRALHNFSFWNMKVKSAKYRPEGIIAGKSSDLTVKFLIL